MEDMTNPSGESSMSVDQAADAFYNKLFTSDSSSEGEASQEAAPEQSAPEQQLEENSIVSEAPEEDSQVVEESLEDSTPDQSEGYVESEKFTIGDDEVSADELIEWRENGLRQADYTRKTQELAQQQREWEEEKAAREAEFTKQWEEKLSRFADETEKELQSFASIDWDTLKAEDPFEYQTKWTDYQRSLTKAEQATKEYSQSLEQAQAASQEQQQAYLAEQGRLAAELIPELADPEQQSTVVTAMTSYMVGAGFTESEINGITDAKALKIIHDAMKFQELSKKGSKVSEKRVVPKTKVMKSGNTSPKSMAQEASAKARSEKMNRLKQSGSIDDAADLFMDMFKR